MLKVTIIAIGDELAEGRLSDENSPFLAGQIRPLGAEICSIVIVPDDSNTLRKAFQTALETCGLVITTGGMGPTKVDLTREVVAEVTGAPLVIDAVALETVRGTFRERGVSPIPEWAPQLAKIPKGALALINPRGLASGFVLQTPGSTIACLPGEPEQVRALWTDFLKPDLERRFNLKETVLLRTLQVAMGEPAVVKALETWLSGRADSHLKVSLRPKAGVVSVDIRVESESEEMRRELMAETVALMRRRLGDAVFGEGDATVEDALVELLAQRGMTIAVAESSTGGAICSRLVNVPGASRVFLEGMICYTNESKVTRLNVPSEFIKMYGAVSESVAMAMATGIRVVAGADMGLAVTGILGPAGGSPEKPVGTTWIACDIEGSMTTSSMILSGGRRTIKRWAARAAINFARLSVLRSGGAF